MSRKSRRELERALEDLDGTGPDSDSGPDLTEAEAAALRAVDSYRIHNRIEDQPRYTPDGRVLYSRDVLEEALASIDDDLEQAFRDRWMPGAVR